MHSRNALKKLRAHKKYYAKLAAENPFYESHLKHYACQIANLNPNYQVPVQMDEHEYINDYYLYNGEPQFDYDQFIYLVKIWNRGEKMSLEKFFRHFKLLTAGIETSPATNIEYMNFAVAFWRLPFPKHIILHFIRIIRDKFNVYSARMVNYLCVWMERKMAQLCASLGDESPSRLRESRPRLLGQRGPQNCATIVDQMDRMQLA